MRWLVVLGLLLLSQPARGDDNDDEDNDDGPGFRREGGTCDKPCTLAALRPLAQDTYVNLLPVRSFVDVCNASSSLTTAQVSGAPRHLSRSRHRGGGPNRIRCVLGCGMWM
jgi:hypothetical protein